MPFHITARIQGHESLFMGLEPQVCALILGIASRSDVQLLAYAVMPNHLHVMLIQGKKELRAFMQPLLRQVALLVLRHHRREGHVFERRYNASICRDPEYFRNALVYVHLNPVRAGLCASPADYAWTSHSAFATATDNIPWPLCLAMHRALRMFSGNGGTRAEEWCTDYSAYVRWRQQLDNHADDPERRAIAEALKPCTATGDSYWHEEFGAATADSFPIGGRRLDLRDMVKRALAQCAPDLPLDLLRSGGRTRPLVAARRQVIRRALIAGYRPCQIARFLNISSTAVSLASRRD